MDIKQIIQRSPSIKIKSPLNVSYNDDKIKCHLCHRSSEKYSCEISIYIVWEPTEQQLSYLNEETFNEFQQEVLADTFHMYRDDRRWNIYFLIISDSLAANRERVYRIERDSDYARKVVLTTDKVEEYLSDCSIIHTSNAKPPENLREEWEARLSASGLDGCVYRDFSSKSVVEYIEKQRAIRTQGGQIATNVSVNNKLSEKKVNHIVDVHFSDFRTHCLNRDFRIKPGLVTLLSGTNGSGKTSICEAIEFGLTGDIRRNESKKERDKSKKGKRNKAEKDNGKIDIIYSDVDNGIQQTDSKKTTMEKRALDLLWYGSTTTSNKTKPHLNENFSKFNFVNANAATKFTSGMNFKENIINTVFGEEITASDRRINRYREEFESKDRTYRKELQEINRTEKEIANELREINESGGNIEVLQKKLNSIGLNTEGFSEKQLLDTADKSIVRSFSNVKVIYEYISSTKHNNYNDLKNEEKKLEKELKNIEQLLAEHSKYTQDVKKKEKYESNVASAKAKIYEWEKIYTNYLDIVKRIRKISNKNDIESFISAFQELQHKYRDLVSIKGNFNEIQNYIINEKEEQKDFKQIEVLNAQLKSINIAKQQLNEKIGILQKNKDETEKTIADIVRVGASFVQKNDSKSCPLCGQLYTSSTELLTVIKKAYEIFDYSGELGELHKRVVEQEELYNSTLEKKSKLEKTRSEYDNIKKCYSLLAKNDIPNVKTIAEKLNYINNVFTTEDTIKNEIDQQKGFYNEAVRFASSNEYMEYASVDSISFEEFYNQKVEELEKEVVENKKSLDGIIEVLGKYNPDILENFKSNNESADNLLSELKKVKSIIMLFDKLAQDLHNINKCENFDMWHSDYISCKDILSIRSLSNKSSLEQNLEKIQKRSNTLSSYLERCKIALNCFSSLRNIEDLFNKFVGNNAMVIEEIFNEIHLPKEFSELSIDSDGIVTFQRSVKKNNGGKVKITKIESDIDEISTGQSIALTIAIIIALHKSAQNAPKLLIFDEPVANMDDIHMLNLIDLLRELALDDTQLIITTANNDIAGLLRRKFSFLENDFKHIKMERTDFDTTIISEKIYSPVKEAVVLERVV